MSGLVLWKLYEGRQHCAQLVMCLWLSELKLSNHCFEKEKKNLSESCSLFSSTPFLSINP